MMEIRPYREADEEEVVSLWRVVFAGAPPWNDPRQDIQRKLLVEPDLFLVPVEGAEVIGTAMAGYDGHRGWVYYVGVRPDRRRRGVGAALMRRVEEDLLRLGCHKLNLQVRASNQEAVTFYEKLGYVIEDRVSMAKRLPRVPEGDRSCPSDEAGEGVFTYRAIGVIHTPHRTPEETPIQPVFAEGARGRVEVYPEYSAGLRDLGGFSHVYLLYALHRAGPPLLRVRPFLDDVERGVFATRAPRRPNPIGLSVVRLLSVEDAVLLVENIDVLDGTPLLDIKPFVPRFGPPGEVRSGWLEGIDDAAAARRGRRGWKPR